VLLGRGQLQPGHLRLLERIRTGPARPVRSVRLRVVEDKHAIAGPDIDCASRLHLCQARCCTLTVVLDAQDVEDGLRFDIDHPYVLRHDADGWCHHLDRGSRGCTVYAQRPAPCRRFDCREDSRIWVDFEARIPAPAGETG
jgi:hypothetical protein